MSDSTANHAPADATGDAESRLPGIGRGPRVLLFLASGLVAGVIAWAIASRTIDFHALPADIAAILSQQSSTAEEKARVNAAVHSRDLRTTTLSAAILGASLGALLGIASGVARRAGSIAAVSVIAGLIVGGLFGAAGGGAGKFLLDRLQPHELDITVKTIAASATMFLVTGVGVGLAPGWVFRRMMANCLEAGLAGLLAGVAVPIAGAILFPVADTDLPVPRESGPLLFWCLIPAALIAVAVGRVKPAPKRH